MEKITRLSSVLISHAGDHWAIVAKFPQICRFVSIMVFRCNVEVQTVIMFGCEQVWWLTIKEVQFLSLGQLNACVLLGQFLFHTGLKLKEITETYKRCQLFRINNVNDVISRSSCKKMNMIRGFSPHFLPSLS